MMDRLSFKLKTFLIQELEAYSKFEIVFTFLSLFIVLIASIVKSDGILAILASIFGLLYTVSAGKGKVYCYYFGIIGTLCCAIVSYKIALFGNFALHFLYYLPMEIIGLYSWRKHLQKESNEIVKTKLTLNGIIILVLSIVFSTLILQTFFVNIKDASPLMDSLILVLSIAGMILTVKRCIEQWLVWTLVNVFSILMWLDVFLQGEKIISIFLIRIVYLIIGIYFYIKWKNSLK